jgi:hypothetical protein
MTRYVFKARKTSAPALSSWRFASKPSASIFTKTLNGSWKDESFRSRTMRRRWFLSIQSNLDGRDPNHFNKRRIMSLTLAIATKAFERVKVKKRLAR